MGAPDHPRCLLEPGPQASRLGARASRREKGAHRHGDVDGDPAKSAGGGGLEAPDLPGLRDQPRTLDKMLANAEPPGYQPGRPHARSPSSGPFLGVIDEILEADKTAPPKQRHTAKRIFERLRDEHGYRGAHAGERGRRPGQARLARRSSCRSPTRRARPSSTSARRRRDRGRRRKGRPGGDDACPTRTPSSSRPIRASAPRPSRPATTPRSSSSAGCPRKSYDNTTVAVKKVGGPEPRAHHRVLAPREPLPLHAPVLPGGAGQREGPRGDPRRLHEAQLPRPGAELRLFRRAERVPRRVL